MRGHKPRERRCIASSEIKDPSGMVRFVLSPDGIVTPDVKGKLPGRGVWVSSDREALGKAINAKGFARGFKRKAELPEDLTAQTEAGLSRHLLGLIAMARKSGQLILGFDQVQNTARVSALAWRIEARDGSADGRGKIRTLSKAVARELGQPLPRLIGCFSARELGETLGRERVIHGAITQGKMAKSIIVSARRLSGFKALIPQDWPDAEHEAPPLNATKTPQMTRDNDGADLNY